MCMPDLDAVLTLVDLADEGMFESTGVVGHFSPIQSKPHLKERILPLLLRVAHNPLRTRTPSRSSEHVTACGAAPARDAHIFAPTPCMIAPLHLLDEDTVHILQRRALHACIKEVAHFLALPCAKALRRPSLPCTCTRTHRWQARPNRTNAG